MAGHYCGNMLLIRIYEGILVMVSAKLGALEIMNADYAVLGINASMIH